MGRKNFPAMYTQIKSHFYVLAFRISSPFHVCQVKHVGEGQTKQPYLTNLEEQRKKLEVLNCKKQSLPWTVTFECMSHATHLLEQLHSFAPYHGKGGAK